MGAFRVLKLFIRLASVILGLLSSVCTDWMNRSIPHIDLCDMNGRVFKVSWLFILCDFARHMDGNGEHHRTFLSWCNKNLINMMLWLLCLKLWTDFNWQFHEHPWKLSIVCRTSAGCEQKWAECLTNKRQNNDPFWTFDGTLRITSSSVERGEWAPAELKSHRGKVITFAWYVSVAHRVLFRWNYFSLNSGAVFCLASWYCRLREKDIQSDCYSSASL